MNRKRVTQIFPWLLPLRKKQRRTCFYLKMKFDGQKYSSDKSAELLPHLLFEASQPMYNEKTGFDMVYQENKVYNLKLAAAEISKILIRPGETFSFSKAVRYADRKAPYKDGLVVIDSELTTAPGGGMCQMSNLLFWLFLHSPLTVVERHGHREKDFPDTDGSVPIGVDATISEGWTDLKVRNYTKQTFQIEIAFDEKNIIGRIFTDEEKGAVYEIVNDNIKYYKKDGLVFEEADIIQKRIMKDTGACAAQIKLYRNKCQIGYPLPESVIGGIK